MGFWDSAARWAGRRNRMLATSPSWSVEFAAQLARALQARGSALPLRRCLHLLTFAYICLHADHHTFRRAHLNASCPPRAIKHGQDRRIAGSQYARHKRPLSLRGGDISLPTLPHSAHSVIRSFIQSHYHRISASYHAEAAGQPNRKPFIS
jgi:hypothetical protein